MTAAELFRRSRRTVVKIGSSLLVGADGQLRQAWLSSLAADIASLKTGGNQIIVVSSGASALGRKRLKLPGRDLRLDEKQAAAAAGQIRLARAYEGVLGEVGLATAQLLLTLDDTEARRRYLNARSTLETLLRLNVVPVVNENDTVATSEIRFGDNDRLSARVAVMASAEMLVLLSDVDGMYTDDPRRNPDARHLPEIRTIDEALVQMAGGAGSAHGTGGMASKLQAAAIATRAGCPVLLAKGSVERPLATIAEGGRASLFHAIGSARRARKEWIAGSLVTQGRLVVDDGAVRALRAGKSLLPAGVTRVEGAFQKGDAVAVEDPQGAVIAKGLSAYDGTEAMALAGRRTEDIERILGYRGRDELIHRDNLVLLT
ncbi:MAG: glutamate 5-kinase [Geminicoccaceae bacterium]